MKTNSLPRHLLNISPYLLFAIFATALWWWVIPHDGTESKIDDAEPSAVQTPSVALTDEKLKTAAIETGQALIREFRPSIQLPGRLGYDENRHVEIRPSTGGTIREIRVLPGEKVASGQVVAIVSSPDVARARAEVVRMSTHLELANAVSERSEKAAAGVRRSIELISDETDPDEMAAALRSSEMGSSLEQILSAYSRKRLADQKIASLESARDSGAVAGSVFLERKAEQQTASAALQSIADQISFDANQQAKKAVADLEMARNQLEISRRELSVLLGNRDAESTAAGDTENSDVPNNESLGELTDVLLRSPIEGTVEQRIKAVGERIAAGDGVLIVADTSVLWVRGEIRSGSWDAISVASGDPVDIAVPAMSGKKFVGEILFAGRSVNPATDTAEIVAVLSVNDPNLRPGMFVEMVLRPGQPRSALAVPESAVVSHNGQEFVFVPMDSHTFKRVDIKTGITDDGWIEIVDGLAESTRVVTSGAFVLKSEMILAAESE